MSRQLEQVASQRLLLVGSSGGHLAQLMRLRPWWQTTPRAWVTFDTPDAVDQLRDEVDLTWAFRPTTRNIPNLLRNTWQAIVVLRRFRPTTIVSTGAGVALPYFVLSRVFGARTVYIEVFDRVETPTLTGRLVRPFTDLMLVQWQEQQALYNDAITIGPLL
jgi:UDP-N-acetylglucosamine:LPS N-acetylglucosamine transferase